MPKKTILLAEDNPDDAFIFEKLFKKAGLPHTLRVVEDGQQALDWLQGSGSYSNRSEYPVPDILLLDLKMPRKTGFEVLEWVRAQRSLQALPVVILSSSDDQKDVNRAHELGATTYFVKSPQLRDVLAYLQAN